MTNPDVFYNREDLWTVASGVGMPDQRQQAMEPNFVLMTLPGERATRIHRDTSLHAGQSQQPDRLDRGPKRRRALRRGSGLRFSEDQADRRALQIEARIDQNAQLSGQLTLWNQQGSHVRRGSLIVIPIGRALLYAEPIYLQADRSPMPELRLVVLAVQDRLAYGPTFESAMAALFGTAPPCSARAHRQKLRRHGTTPLPGAAPRARSRRLIAEAARDFADYQQLTAAGKLAEAGEKLEALKRTGGAAESPRLIQDVNRHPMFARITDRPPYSIHMLPRRSASNCGACLHSGPPNVGKINMRPSSVEPSYCAARMFYFPANLPVGLWQA